jgi:hypothetical protein
MSEDHERTRLRFEFERLGRDDLAATVSSVPGFLMDA